MPPVTEETERRPLRRRADAVLSAGFKLTLITMLALGAVVVLVQIVGLLTVNAGLVEGAANALQPTLFAISAGFGVLTMALAYVRGWKNSE